MIGELDVFPHNLAAGSPLIVGDLLFTVTGNGVDEGHVNIPAPRAPSFVAVNKKTGELVWESAAPGDEHPPRQWSNPAYGVIGGKPQVIFPGGDGWLYSFEPKTGKLLWKFDCNPKDSVWELGRRGTRNNVISTPVIYDDMVYIGVGQDPEHGEGAGQLLGHRRHEARRHHRDGRASGTAAARTSTARCRPPRSTTACSTSPTSAASSTASTPRPASTTGRTTPSPRSGARPSSPTARSTSATRTATSRCWPPARR